MPKVDSSRVQVTHGASYPAPFDEPCRGRTKHALGDAVQLTQFGVHVITLAPGAWASQRHWHSHEDEFVYVLSGELVLVEDAGETKLSPGDAAGWPAGVQDGHHLINRGHGPAQFLVVGGRDNADSGVYTDIDMMFSGPRYGANRTGLFRHKDGTPYP